MKRLTTTFLILITISCSAQKQVPISDMTPSDWTQDLEYLNRRIQKEFVSFDPEVKGNFDKGIQNLKNNLNQFSNNEVTFKIMQLMAGLGDGHTELQVFGEDIAFKRLPISLYYFQEGLYLVGGHEFLKEHIGSQVTHIGGIPSAEILERLTKLIAHDNQYEILHSIPSYLLLPQAMKFMGLTDDLKQAQFRLKDSNGQIKELNIEAMSIEDYLNGKWINYRNIHNITPPLSATPSEKWHWYRYIPESKTMYFYYGSVSNQDKNPKIKKVIKSLFAEIDEIKPEKLIIDMRRNSGGNYNNSQPLLKAIQDRKWLNQKDKIYAISGRRTFSAAMVTSVWLKNQTNTMLIGEPARKAVGSALPFFGHDSCPAPTTPRLCRPAPR